MKKIWIILKHIHTYDSYVLGISAVYAICLVLKPFALMYATGMIVNGMMRFASYSMMIRIIFRALGLVAGIQGLEILFKKFLNDKSLKVHYALQRSLIMKAWVMEFGALESSENRLNFQKAEEGSNYSGGIITFVKNVITSTFELLTSIILLVSTLSVIFTAKSYQANQFIDSPLYPLVFCILLVVPILISFYSNTKAAKHHVGMFHDMAYINRKMGYLMSTLIYDIEPGKTIRLYDGAPLLLNIVKDSIHSFIDRFRVGLRTINTYTARAQVITILCTGCLYGMLILKAQSGALEIGTLITLGGTLQLVIATCVKNISDFINAQNIIQIMQHYIDYLDLPEVSYSDKSVRFDNPHIEFRNVSFKYPGSDVEVLKNVSFDIFPNERVSLVGKNGAGKTTAINLLARLYKPTSGNIYINGIDIHSLLESEYLSNISVVFQDFKLFPFTLKENIVMDQVYDANRLNSALDATHLLDRVATLEDGIDTFIKDDYNDGVSLSGGEAQKVAISRAWYKDAPLLILDEPTAALDPLSEFEIYNHFNDLMENRTAVYISHRMSASSFSDRIIVFDKGCVCETGTHQELLRANGVYKTLYETQAQYYK